MNRKKVWSKETESSLEQMVDYVRQAIIKEAENFTDFLKKNEVDAQSLTLALYKVISLLNQSNYAIIIKSIGIDEGSKIIQLLENSSQNSVTKVLYNDIIDKIPPELRDIFKKQFGSSDENGDV